MKKITKTFKVERQISPGGCWYEVMLSPFENKEEVEKYLLKYSIYYPSEDRHYRVTNLKTNKFDIINL